MTFTMSIASAESEPVETHTVLMAAIFCNLAWGVVDAAMYLLATFAERARNLATFRAVRAVSEPDAARQLILDALPPAMASALTPLDLERVRQHLNQHPEPAGATLNQTDFLGALGVCLLVFSSTLPVVLPFYMMRDPRAAFHASNGIAIGLLFVTGWSLGIYTGRPGWRTGLVMVLVGLALVAITTALGG